VPVLEVAVELVKSGAHFLGGSDGPEGVVLVDLGDPKHRHDGIPDVLFYGPAVALQQRPHPVEVRGHHSTEDLGI
jgi:hypothetical protein